MDYEGTVSYFGFITSAPELAGDLDGQGILPCEPTV
jgi:hypothetical protein